MEKRATADYPLISELQQTIRSLRELVEQTTRTNNKDNAHLIEQHNESENSLKQTIIKLREQITSIQFSSNELSIKFSHDISSLHKEKIEGDKHFQRHMQQLRIEFEQSIQKLHLAKQQQQKIHQSEVKELYAQVKQIRHQMDNLSVEGAE